MKKYFDILNVSYNSSIDEIKNAYKEQIKKWHPDRFSENSQEQIQATEKCKEINRAYDILKQFYKENKPKKVNDQTDKFVWERVKSSNIHSVGYNESTKTLRILFLNGGRYEYANVSKSIYDQLMNSPSKGKFAYNYIYYNYAHKTF